MQSISVRLGAVAAIALAAPCGAQVGMPTAVSMMPDRVSFLIAADLRALRNESSVLWSTETDSVLADLRKEEAVAGPAQSPQHAMIKAVLDPELFPKIATVAFGGDPPSLESLHVSQPSLYMVILGKFTQQEAYAALKKAGFGPGPKPKVGQVSFPDGAPVYAAAPQENIILIGNEIIWLGNATTISSTKRGLIRKEGRFSGTVSTFGGRAPDLLVFMDGVLSPIRRPNPQFAGLALAAFPGADPQIELHGLLLDDRELKSSKEYMPGMVSFIKQSAPTGTDTQSKLLAKAAAALKFEFSGSSMIFKLPIDDGMQAMAAEMAAQTLKDDGASLPLAK